MTDKEKVRSWGEVVGGWGDFVSEERKGMVLYRVVEGDGGGNAKVGATSNEESDVASAVNGMERDGVVSVTNSAERKQGKVFLVDREKTIEVRTDEKLGRLLRGKYESVMESRYFGRGGIEVVLSGQLDEGEVRDLIRLSYELSKKMAE